MKLKYRKLQANPYGEMLVQIIEHPFKGSLTVDCIGYLKFRKFDGENKYCFVGYQIEGDKVEDLNRMYKIVKYIRDNSYVYAPIEEVLSLFNAEEYRIFENEFISVLDVGKKMFKVIQEDGRYYSVFPAANILKAEKEVLKRYPHLESGFKLIEGNTITF